MTNNDIGIRNSDIWMSRLIGENSVTYGSHPIIAIQNEVSCITSPNVTVIPIVSNANKQPTHVIIPCNYETGLQHQSISIAEGITTISKKMLLFRIGFANEELMRSIEHSLLIHLSMINPLNKSLVNNLCNQICGTIKILKTEILSEHVRKVASNTINLHYTSLALYCKIHLIDYKKILTNELRKNGIKLSCDDITKIYKIYEI